jgi:hypothetical protein
MSPSHHLLQGHKEFLIEQDHLQEVVQSHLLLLRQFREGMEIPLQQGHCENRADPVLWLLCVAGDAAKQTLAYTSSVPLQMCPAAESAMQLRNIVHQVKH